MEKKLKIGIIGTGQIGKNHIRRYQEIPEAEIVAVCDLNLEEAQRVAGEYGIGRALEKYEDLLAIDEIEAVDVCLHNRLHAPVTIAALQAGKHVFCEKPMSHAYSEALKMYEEATKRNLHLSIQCANVFSPQTKAAKRLIDDGHLGDIYMAKSCHVRRRGRPFVDGYGTPAFVNTRTAGGGALLDMAVYHINRMLYLLDCPEVVSVSGMTYDKIGMYPERRESSGYDVEEFGLGYVRLEGGISFSIEEAWALHTSQNTTHSAVYGNQGGVVLESDAGPLTYHTTLSDMEMNATFELGGAETRRHRTDPTYVGFDSPQHHWVHGVLGNVKLIDMASIALRTSLITEGIYRSAGEGRELTADEIV